ncbi:MAG: hypothetical protein Q9170_006082 [Blastenia crenularia]
MGAAPASEVEASLRSEALAAYLIFFDADELRRSLHLDGWTYRFISTQIIQPARSSLSALGRDLDLTMQKYLQFVNTLDSYAPSWTFTLSYGETRLRFYSLAPIPWHAVTSIVKTFVLLNWMWLTLFSHVAWQYAQLAAIGVLFYHVGDRLDRMIPV